MSSYGFRDHFVLSVLTQDQLVGIKFGSLPKLEGNEKSELDQTKVAKCSLNQM